MGHVDDPHDTEGDRQADRGEHVDRAEAEPEEKRLDDGVQASILVDLSQGRLRRRSNRRIRIPALLSNQRRKSDVHGLVHASRESLRCRGAFSRVGRSESGQSKCHPDRIVDPAVRLFDQTRLQQLHGFRSQLLVERLDRVQPLVRVLGAEAQLGDGPTQKTTNRVVDHDPLERSLLGLPERFTRKRVADREHRALLLDQHDPAVALPVGDTPGEQGLEQALRLRITDLGDLADRLRLRTQTSLAELAHQRLEVARSRTGRD